MIFFSSTTFSVPMVVLGAWTLWTAWCLNVNYTKARRMGVPILVRYITPTNIFWMMLGNYVVDICRRCPFGNGHFTRFYAAGWASKERHRVHTELGDVFMLVTPGGNRLYVADGEAALDVLHRRNDFRRDLKMMQMLSLYGKNVFTTDGPEWQKHRKATMGAFQERNNEGVWKESLSQANAMLQCWLASGSEPVRTVSPDTKILTLNVLTAALFSKRCTFGMNENFENTTFGREDASYQYRDSLGRILRNIIPILIFGGKMLQSCWMPTGWRRAGQAVYKFRAFVTELMDEEKSDIARGTQPCKQNLVRTLVRACDIQRQESTCTRKGAVTEDEIISNLFVYAVAGNDTTSITLAHAIVFLAAHPGVQAWLAEEILHYLPEGDFTRWGYDTFSKLKRCQAIILETLRMCHPRFKPNPRYWGEDSLVWNPARWIIADPSGDLVLEKIMPDSTQYYYPWAFGHHVCPGKKFSQVEIVAVLAMLFRAHRVQPRLAQGETPQQGRLRILSVGMDTQSKVLLHEMRHSEKAGLDWIRRDG